MIYIGGAVVYSDAVRRCEQLGATVLGSHLIQSATKYIHSKSQYRDVDGSLKNALLWIHSGLFVEIQSKPKTSKHIDKCNVYSPGDKNLILSNCNILRPYICAKFSVVSCKNSCFHHGACIGRKCVCYEGWNGNDCSQYHCSDVNDCFGRGECVGPNQCRCKAGWTGRACSKSYCPRHDNCLSCSRITGCGWCDQSHKCIPGTGHGPDVGSCSSWFYYKCITLGSNTHCSNEIYPIECNQRYCNVSNSQTNKGICQACEDVKRCYKGLVPMAPDNTTCSTWNEDKCPQGVVRPDYSNPSRVDNTVMSDKAIFVDPTDLLIYFCPVMVNNETGDTTNVYIVREDRGWKAGQILSSPQAGGILTKLQLVTPLEKGMVMLFGGPASIADIIQYADFRDQKVPFENIGDKLTQDQMPPKYLEKWYYNGTLIVTDGTTFHTLPTEGVAKCVGHEYRGDNGTTVYSYYAVVPATDETRQYVVDDVVVSDYSQGLLETVDNITTTKFGTFVFTHLTQCSGDTAWNINLRTDQPYGNMTGESGDNWPGMIFYEDKDVVPANIGDTLIGRRSFGVFGKVIDISEKQGFLLIEVIAVEAVDEGNVVTVSQSSTLHRIHRRKRTTVTLSESGSKTLSWDSGVRLYLVFCGIVFHSVIDVHAYDFKLAHFYYLSCIFTAWIFCIIKIQLFSFPPSYTSSEMEMVSYNFTRSRMDLRWQYQ